MKLTITFIVTLVFAALAAIHFYWGLGGRWGADAVIPRTVNNKKLFDPGVVSCFAVALSLLVSGALVLIKAGIIPADLPDRLLSYGIWTIAVMFLLRAIGEFKYVGFFKKVKTTTFGQLDTAFYSPLCLIIGVLLVLLELNP